MSSRTHLRRAALATLVLAASATPAAIAAAAKERPVGPRLQAIIDHAVRAPKSDIPGVALYVRAPGQPAWSGAAGKMRPGDRFRAGSIMKPFIAAATLQQVEQGRFSLDAPLTSVLAPRITARFADAEQTTVRMLLDHTSGIGEFDDAALDHRAFQDMRRRWTTAEFLERGAKAPRTGAPGERFAYSNTNYTLLGLILEQATGKSWRTVVREDVIDRVGLRHTSLPAPGTMPRGRGIAHGYEVLGGRLRDVT
jgi:D-alanyl-D-alanine carboxypeptidase